MLGDKRGTNPSGPTGPHIIGQTVHECRVSHQDDCLDLVHGRSGDLDGGVGVSLISIATSAEGDVEYLRALASC